MFRIVIKLLMTVAIQLVSISSISVAQPTRVTVSATPVNFVGPCPTTITFSAKIRMSAPGAVRYVWVRSDGATSEVQTINFPAPGELEVTSTWTLGSPGSTNRDKWEAIRILRADGPPLQSNAARFRLRCLSADQGREYEAGREAGRWPDLTVSFANRPNAANPRAVLVARNNGSALAPGTDGTSDSEGFMIDVVLSTDHDVPLGPAVFSPNFSEDVMVLGGRISLTRDLAGGGARPYSLRIQVPADTPAANYFVCARIDPFNKVMESIEANNVACVPFVVRLRQ